MPADEGVVVACPLLDLLQMEIKDLLLALPQAVALLNQLVFSALDIIPGLLKSLRGKRWQLLALLLMLI